MSTLVVTVPGATAKISIVLFGGLIQLLICQSWRLGFSLPRPIQRIDDAWTRFVDKYPLLWWLGSTSVPIVGTFIVVRIMRDGPFTNRNIEGTPITVSIRDSMTETTFTGQECAIQSSMLSMFERGIAEGLDFVIRVGPPTNSATATPVE